MGCDIHSHVETGHISKADGKTFWSHLCDFHFGRNYMLFALMAGVRRYNYFPDAKLLEEALAKRGVASLGDPLLSEAEEALIVQEASDNGVTYGQPSFVEKGIPDDIDWKTTQEFTLSVVDDDDSEADLDGCCSRSQAERWIKEGSSEPWGSLIDGKIVRITHPDWHTMSWLNTKEMETVAQRYRLALETSKAEWADPRTDQTLAKVDGLVEMMKCVERPGNIKARVVFWFDN